MTQSKNGKLEPFEAGQMVGMLVVLESFERSDIEADVVRKLKQHCAAELESYLDRPAEDVLLMVANQLNESGIL